MKYHLGCGGDIRRGFTNVDKHNPRADVQADILTMRYQRCEHVEIHHAFEHFGYVDSLVLLTKWALALKPGGILVVDVPDVEMLTQRLNGNNKRARAIMRLLFGSQEAGWAYHINGWTPHLLSETLRQYGFSVEHTRRYGDINADFPNLGFEVRAKKTAEIRVETLAGVSTALLIDYCHPSESALYVSLCGQYHRGIECCQ